MMITIFCTIQMKKFLFKLFLLLALLVPVKSFSGAILVSMDESQKNHLKAYGVAYWALDNEIVIEWLLNYQGGSFLFPQNTAIEEQLIIKGISYRILPDVKVKQIKAEIANPEVNMEVVQL